MIQKYVDRFYENKTVIRERLAEKHVGSYEELVKIVIEAITNDDNYGEPDPERIHVIDDGDYQGTLLFIIGAKGYQPHEYWSVYVGYGSCSGCDTLQGISDYSSDPPTEEQINDYMSLALHVVQSFSVV